MKKILISHIILIFFLAATAAAMDFSGTFIYSNNKGWIKIVLAPDGLGGYKGRLTSENDAFSIQGHVRKGMLKGTVGQGDQAVAFSAGLNKNSLAFTLFELDRNGTPIIDTAHTLPFVRQDNQAKKATAGKGQVIINGRALSKKQIAQIEAQYNIRPLPGRYWYDTKSGLYGVEGYPAYGFMLSGHNFGTLSRQASNGNTGVILNGRVLPQSEWTVWSYMLGYWIQPGAYWMDHQGNAGYQGNPIPMVNLFVAARQNGYSGQGGSGDNFWSSRFSAGNYDSGNQRGYVSVPGHGPVGYGF